MKKFNLKMAATVMICGSFLFSSCIGSFGLHSKLVSWNQGIGTKFVNELVYLAFNIVPVYGVCYLADALVINSIEFWSGSNPMASIGDVKKVKGENGEISIDWINEDLITFVKDRLGHDQRYAIDPTKITNALGWYPETKFEVGIVKTIEWSLNNQPWVEEVTSGDYQKYYEQMYGGRG